MQQLERESDSCPARRRLRCAAQAVAWALAVCAAAAAAPPSRQEVEPWLGRFAAGPETLSFRWADGLVADLGRITVAVDGEWHETVATFAVRHRLTWIPERGAITLEEQHDEGAHWRYELRLEDGGERLVKLELGPTDGAEPTVVRTYRRQP